MTVGELGVRMDASELMEWAAFSNLANDDYKAKIERCVAEEATAEQQAEVLRNFLNQIKPSKKTIHIRKPLNHGSKR